MRKAHSGAKAFRLEKVDRALAALVTVRVRVRVRVRAIYYLLSTIYLTAGSSRFFALVRQQCLDVVVACLALILTLFLRLIPTDVFA